MNNNRAIIELVRSISGQSNVLTIPKFYIDLTGDHIAALFLSQCVYWSDRNKNNGWFYKTEAEWQEELGISPYQVRRARKILEPYIETKLKKANNAPTVHYKVNIENLTNAIIDLLSNKVDNSESEVSSLSRNFINQDNEETSQSLTETTNKTTDSTAKAVSDHDENSDPLAGYFGSNGSQPKEQAAQAEKPKKLNKLAAARLRLHTAFAEGRGCSLPEWKTDKQKKANSTNWNKAVDRLMQECDGDLDLAERIIREDVKSYLMGEKDPRYPMVEPRSFESRWIARAIDARMKSALSTPQYFRASDVPQGKTILEFQQEIAGD